MRRTAYNRAVKAWLKGESMATLKQPLIDKEDIKTMIDIDTYRFQHPVNDSILSRYKTMVMLYGTDNADRMMRELEVQSW